MDILGGATALLVHSALDALSYRHSVISNNIANAKTAGFSPKYLEFEQYLQRIMSERSGADIDGVVIKRFDRFEDDLLGGRLTKTAQSKPVELDTELARLTDNLLRYQALLEGLNKRSALLKMAIREGKG